MTPDRINALFEISGALLTWVNVYRVWKDKGYAGLYAPAIVLFTSWGIWNLYYYAALLQPWSVAATYVMVAANCSWCGLMAYFGRIQRDR